MKRIAVIGESCIDQYVYGTCERVCPEAAALCFKHSEEYKSGHGMAGNVYQNLLSLNNNEFKIDLISSESSIIKKRFVDTKYNTIIFREDINDSCGRINIKNYDFSIYSGIIFSDYCKGFLKENDILNICKKINSSCITFLDTKKKLSSKLMSNINIVKINQNEYQNNITNKFKIPPKCYLIVTQGDNGAYLYHKNTIKHFATNKVILRDVCGAGDTFLAALSISYLKEFDIDKSINFANQCAARVVSQFGVCTI
jgi:bifunctional ADP-heptose synthase (sugar kinase/adenylyltransferase)